MCYIHLGLALPNSQCIHRYIDTPQTLDQLPSNLIPNYLLLLFSYFCLFDCVFLICILLEVQSAVGGINFVYKRHGWVQLVLIMNLDHSARFIVSRINCMYIDTITSCRATIFTCALFVHHIFIQWDNILPYSC